MKISLPAIFTLSAMLVILAYAVIGASTDHSRVVPSAAALQSQRSNLGHWIDSPVINAARKEGKGGDVAQAMLNEAKVANVETPLLEAVSNADVKTVQRLLEEGANPDDPAAARSPLVQAMLLSDGQTLRCNLPIVQLLLKHGANPNRPDAMLGIVPLLHAFGIADLKCAEILRAAGAPADTRGMGGDTILHEAVDAAAQSGDLSVVDTALSWGIDKNVQLLDGYTALHTLVNIRGAKVIRALLDRGFDACLKNKIGQTPLDMAINLYHNRTSAEENEILNTLKLATVCR